MLKVEPPEDYPPEDGRYLRGNDYSPVAVVAILDTFDDAIPLDIEKVVKVAIESGAALAGTLQTENVGTEKMITNIVANPNIRYLILCGRESPGHSTGEALAALIKNGVDDKKRIAGTKAPTPTLFNIPTEAIERFRSQITLVNLLIHTNPVAFGIDSETVKKAVQACYQEEPTEFMDYTLCDPGAYPDPPLCGKITWRVTKPWEQAGEEELKVLDEITKKASKGKLAKKKIKIKRKEG